MLRGLSAAVLGGCVVLGLLLSSGCVPELSLLGLGGDSIVAGAQETAEPSTPASEPSLADAASPSSDGGNTFTPASLPLSTSVSGTVSGTGSYQRFEFGPGAPGDTWRVTANTPPLSASFVVVLLDERDELLYRRVLGSQDTLEHILRYAAGRVSVGIMPLAGSSGGSFDLRISRVVGSVPPPRPERVYLNFAGGSGVRVQNRAALSFPAFDAASLGSAYVGLTDEIKRGIVATVRADYAPYDVIIMTSDEGPLPSGSVAVLHFGGNDPRLLGLAAGVDLYNSQPGGVAVIYTDSFAPFAAMRLEPAEFASMIGNTASHELGHLLGLFHTRQPDDVMDTTGSAWDLVGEQTLGTAPLEPTVFAVGSQNAPAILAAAVGLSPTFEPPGKSAPVAKGSQALDPRRKIIIDIASRCGTCLELEEGE